MTIRPYANLPLEQRPTLFYAGDGVSDLSAAKETDMLFAKVGKGMLPRSGSENARTLLTVFADLVTYCKRENVPYLEFDSFSDILATMKEVVAGKKTVPKLQHAS